MAFSFEINRPEDISKTLESVAHTVRSGGGRFSGNEQYGYFSGRGVQGRYSVGNENNGGKVTITITRKPMFASDAAVQSTITDYFTPGF